MFKSDINVLKGKLSSFIYCESDHPSHTSYPEPSLDANAKFALKPSWMA